MREVVNLVQLAGQTCLTYWGNKQISITKKADNSPVTEADIAINELLVNGLSKLTPKIAILSEESSNIALPTRLKWQKWWLVDPLDGTKEFIDNRKDFTVNVALIEQGEVIFGVVGIPVTANCFFGGKSLGAWQQNKEGACNPIHCRSINNHHLAIVASHRHTSPEQQQFINNLQQTRSVSQKNIGSSLKFCLIAKGEADCYPRFAPTSQWDTAAAQGVLEGAGGIVLTDKGETLDYKAKDSYLNPYFIAIGDSHYRSTILELLPISHAKNDEAISDL